MAEKFTNFFKNSLLCKLLRFSLETVKSRSFAPVDFYHYIDFIHEVVQKSREQKVETKNMIK